jgi:hypothetical protein
LHDYREPIGAVTFATRRMFDEAEDAVVTGKGVQLDRKRLVPVASTASIHSPLLIKTMRRVVGRASVRICLRIFLVAGVPPAMTTMRLPILVGIIAFSI